MQGIHLARRIAKLAWAKKAEDVVILDVRGLTDTTDFFVICTGGVGMHVRSITDFVMDEARELGEKAHVSERDSDEWMVVDFVNVIFHCFQPAKRRLYNLERLWCDGLRLEVDERTGVAGTLKDAKEDLERRREAAALRSAARKVAKDSAKQAAKTAKAASPARKSSGSKPDAKILRVRRAPAKGKA